MPDELISLNLGENLLRLAKATNEGGKINVELLDQELATPAFYESETKKVTDETIQIIKRKLDVLKLQKRRVNIIVPDGFTYSQLVFMPKLKEKELLSAIRYQADQFIPMPIDETSLDLEILYESKTENKALVLIIAAPQKLIERIEFICEQVNLYPESIENELSATGRFLENFFVPPTASGGSVFLNFGYSYSSFYYFDNQLKLILDSHSFPAGLSVFLREAQADVNIDILKARDLLKKAGFSEGSAVDLNQILQPAVDALSLELQKFITSVRSKHNVSAISHLYLFNLAPEINNFAKKISQTASLPAAIYDPVIVARRTPAVESHSKDLPAFVASLGGCLR